MAKFQPKNQRKKSTGKNDFKKCPKSSKLHPAYDIGANILRMMSLKQAPFTTLIARYIKLSYCKLIYALVIRVLKNQDVVEKIYAELKASSELNEFLIRIFIGEILFGQNSYKTYRHTNEISFALENEAKIRSLHSKYKNKCKTWQNNLKYIRINRLKITKDKLKEVLVKLGFKFITYDKKSTSFEAFKKLAKSLKPKELMFDCHFDEVLLVNDADINFLHNSEVLKNHYVAIQDKASLLSLEAMDLHQGVTVFDACAAPGMKTLAIASRLNNQCTLYCNDRDVNRYKEMKKLLLESGITPKEVLNCDFTEMEPEKYSNLDVLLLDPSCSGSGIYRRFDFNTSANGEEDSKRIEKLATFQFVMLEAAIKFNPKRLVYCTCSIHQQENEDVIGRLMENYSDLNYAVVDPMPKWPVRGTGDYPFSKLCIRANFEDTLTNGFFCCLLVRKDLLDSSMPTKENGITKKEVLTIENAEEENKDPNSPTIEDEKESFSEIDQTIQDFSPLKKSPKVHLSKFVKRNFKSKISKPKRTLIRQPTWKLYLQMRGVHRGI